MPRRLLLAFALLGCAGSGTAVQTGSPYEPPAPERAVPAGPADTTGMTRIRFDRGTTSDILNDSLAAGGDRAYLLEAEGGQVMLVHAIAWDDGTDGAEATVQVSRADGGTLETAATRESLWFGRLPVSGDYVVRVRAPAGPAAYTLAVQIPRKFELYPDGPPASLTGEAPSRAPVDYMVSAGQGATLEAEVRGDHPDTHVHIFGLGDGAQLAPLSDRRRSFAGIVPLTQDYIVSVVPAGEGDRYELTVRLR